MTASSGSAPANVPGEPRQASESLSEVVYQAVRADIMACRLAPGAGIDATETAARFGVSKTPVRDAMKRLALENLVEVLPRSGYRVKRITFQAVHELLDLRAALGPHAARMAAAYVTADEIRTLRVIVASGYEAMSSQLDIQSAARRFHVAVARASRNERLALLTDNLFEELERVLRLSVDFSTRKSEDSSDHLRLVDALERRDGDEAAEIERRHIAKARTHLLETLWVQGHLSQADISGPAGTKT